MINLNITATETYERWSGSKSEYNNYIFRTLHLRQSEFSRKFSMIAPPSNVGTCSTKRAIKQANGKFESSN
ncbi:hypothetical protein EUGRSUZ_J02843 [Eucalyptus grandis]|uniref:Uncharacterized protein n=2 Tax=Eucalyptus grandis TaxID=71139 RepID=A0ACC3J9P1_EUCGR|nr:hypothetical protein EUGRSUZ_J02843 [Eucalyptus grandis]